MIKIGLLGFDFKAPNKGCEALSYAFIEMLSDISNESMEIHVFSYTLVAEGINKCLKKFIESPEWRNINWKLNFWMDNITGEKTKIWDADGLKEKARYVKYCIKK